MTLAYLTPAKPQERQLTRGIEPTRRHKRDASGRVDRWYVARVHPGMENIASKHLEEQAYGAFVPSHIPDGKTKTGAERAKLPLFPGYIFVKFDIAFDRWQPINSTRGVMHLLPQGRETPLAIPSEFVDRIQARMQAGDFKPAELTDILKALTPGDQIQIIDGPFAGFPGSFEKLRGRGLELIVMIFGRATPVLLEPRQVRLPELAEKDSTKLAG